MKTCKKCNQTKYLLDFNESKSSKDGHYHWCKECWNDYQRTNYPKHKEHRQQRYLKNRDQLKIERLKNKEELREKSRDYYKKNKEKLKQKAKEYYAKRKGIDASAGKEINRKPRIIAQKTYYQKNREKILAKAKLRYARLRQTGKTSINIKYRHTYKQLRKKNPKARLNDRMCRAINDCLRGKNRLRSKWIDLVGYNVFQLKRHLQKQFKFGMCWENYGEWHIDHIIPISAFNFEKPEDIDFKKCWRLSNLRPLWKKDNLAKGNKLLRHFQPSLVF